MLNTKLILIEGLPGAGKSATTRYLGTLLRQHGLVCYWHLEEDEPHPINCLNFPLRELSQRLPPLWRVFTQQALRTSGMTIIESRLWQNTALFMYMSEHPIHDILQLQNQVAHEITDLSPVLVYLYQDNVQTALRRLYTFRDESSINADIQMTSEYPWFRSRGLSDFSGWVQFFQEWQGVAEQLYEHWPHPKLRVVNAHNAWGNAHRQICDFLQIESNS